MPTAAATLELDAPESVRALIEAHVVPFSRARQPVLPVDEEDLPAFERAPDGDRVEQVASLRRARQAIPPLLETEGYFAAKVETVQGTDGQTILRVDPGPQTQVSEVSIEFTGALGADQPALAERRAALAASWTLGPGTPFRQAAWAAAKEQLLAKVSARDYASARIVDSKLDVDPVRSLARIKLVVDSGPPFILGRFSYSGLSRYDESLVARYNKLAVGEPYDYERLVSLQNALQSTPYFAGAIVEVDRNRDTASAAPVTVRLSEAKPRRFGIGLGYSTNTGARTELNYRDANLFANAWELNTSLRLEEKRQSAFADVFLPQSNSGFRDAVGATALNEDIENLSTRRYAFGVTRARSLAHTEVRAIINYQNEITRPEGAFEARTTALTLNYGADWRDVDNPSDPRAGAMLGFQIGGGAKNLLSDQDFLRLYGRGNYYRPIGRSGSFLLRSELGYTVAESREGIPQDFLFRTGGAQSVRGYSYQSLGVKEGNATVGGRTLAVASAEYIYWVREPWGMALFADVGDAADDWNAMKARWGYGLGGRWRSPAGPIGLDVAYAEEERKLRLQFTISLSL